MTLLPPPSPEHDLDNILIVDDQEPNRVLLSEMLSHAGYQVVSVRSGAEALAYVAQSEPGLMLLDVNMPGMDGFEVCRRLRANPRTESLPIILVTALAYREHRLEGIAAGANDYLTKPIDRADLLLRVRNALHLRRLHRELAAQLARLRRTEHLRDSLVHMLVHDLRSPLTSIMAYLEFTRDTLVSRGEDDVVADLDMVRESTTRLTRMVNDVLDVSRLEEDVMPLQRTTFDLRALVTEVVAGMTMNAQEARIAFAAQGEAVMVSADRSLIHRVISNLVDNAVKFTPRGGAVHIEVLDGRAGPEVRVSDAGPGIAFEHHRRIFEKFGTVEESRIPGMASSGLGLTFCKLVIEAHQGRIGLQSVPGEGSTFWFALPSIE